MWSPLNIFKVLFQKAKETTIARTASKQAKIAKFRTDIVYSSAKSEKNVLEELKKKVYAQDKKSIKQLLILLDNIDAEKTSVKNGVLSLRTRIGNIRLNKMQKNLITPLIRQINNLEKNYDRIIIELKNDVEVIKASIKDNDFQWAEQKINNAINKQVELDNMIDQITQKRVEINGILNQTPLGTSP